MQKTLTRIALLIGLTAIGGAWIHTKTTTGIQMPEHLITDLVKITCSKARLPESSAQNQENPRALTH